MLIVALLHTAAARAVTLTADCDGLGSVSIGEVQKCANIFSGASLSICPPCDRGGDGHVSIGDVQTAGNCFSKPAGCPLITPAATTPTRTVTSMFTATFTPSSTRTITPTSTRTGTRTPTATPSATLTPLPTSTPTPTPTLTRTRTATVTPSATLSPTATRTLTNTATTTPTRTQTTTPSGTRTRTRTQTPSLTPTATSSPQMLQGDDVVQAASQVSVTTMTSVEVDSILDFGGIFGAGAGASRGQAATSLCLSGSKQVVSCNESNGGSTRTTQYANCAEMSAASQTVTRTGTIEQTVDGTNCNVVPDPNMVATADATIHFLPGFTLTAGTTTLSMPADLTLKRDQSGTRTTLNGTQEFNDAAAGEHYTQIFQDFVMTRTPQGNGSMVTQDGIMTVDCLGGLQFSTQTALQFETSGQCPLGGQLQVNRPTLAQGGAASGQTRVRRTSVRAPQQAQLAVTPDAGFRQFLLRSQNGKSYQVIQNSNSDKVLGAESFRVTSVVGSLDELAGGCSYTGNSTSRVQAVAASNGQLFPPSSVFKSPRIGDAGLPCFNENANGGDGGVCIGPECSALDCLCEPGSNCTSFTIKSGTVIKNGTEDVPAADSANVQFQPTSPPTSCSGFDGQSTYGIASAQPLPSGPTTEAATCSLVPADGFSLPSMQSFPGGTTGSTVIFAYDTPSISLFTAASAGFSVDVDGNSKLKAFGCTKMNEILNSAHNELGSIPAPEITYTGAGGVSFNFNGDAFIDKSFVSCQAVSALRKCVAPPQPTPTQGTPGACPQSALPAALPTAVAATTKGHANGVGGASCGDGGNISPEASFAYAAPTDGDYTFSTTGALDTLLYVRDKTCNGPELACNDDRTPGEPTSEVTLHLTAGQQIVVIVDGYGGGSGDFMLAISKAGNGATPAPTATPTVFGGAKPDLVVQSVTAPSSGTIGQQILVSATIANQGTADAGTFGVTFVFASDPGLTQVVATGALSCTFSGLGVGAGNTAVCPTTGSPSPIDVPFVASGNYFLGAIVDSADKVSESNEANNTKAVPISIHAPVKGVQLQADLFRAGDGTVYELLRAIEVAEVTAAEEFRVTTLAASTGVTGVCYESGASPGMPVSALAGTFPGISQLYPLENVLRTPIVSSNDLTQVNFDSADSGTLELGLPVGGAFVSVCLNPADCPADTRPPLLTLSTADSNVPAACTASPLSAACSGPGQRQAFAFGVPASGNICLDPNTVTTNTTVCAPRPADGFTLRAGQAIVFVYHQDLADSVFSAGFTGFEVDTDQQNPEECVGPGNQVIGGLARVEAVPPPPPTPTPTGPTPTATRTLTKSPTQTPTGTLGAAATSTLTATPTRTPTRTATGTLGPTSTPTPSPSPTSLPVACLRGTLSGSLPLTVSGSTAGGANSVGGASCGGGGTNAPDAAYAFAAPAAGVYAFDTVGSNFDTILYLRDSDCSGHELTGACNDDIVPSTNLQSRVTVGLVSGQDLVVVVDGFGTFSGNYTLNVSTPCPQSEATGTLPITINGNTAGHINQVGGATCGLSGGAGSNAPEASLGFTAPSTGTYTIDTVGSAFDTILYVRDGSCTGAQLANGCNDDINPPTILQSQVSVSLTQGQRVIIVVDGFQTASGLYTLHISGPT